MSANLQCKILIKHDVETDNNKMAMNEMNCVEILTGDMHACHWIYHYPVDSAVCLANTYLLDSDLSGSS